MRLLLVIALATAGLLTACGGDDRQPAALGSPENPVVAQMPESESGSPAAGARSNEGSAPADKAGEQPGYKALVDRQSAKPRERFTPCNLVGPARARAIVGAPLEPPVEAPQGPTCIYRKRGSDELVTLAVQQARFAQLKRQVRGAQSVDVSSRAAVCGVHGRPVLYMPLGGGRVLSIAAPCATATEFARAAVRRLGA
jgi:hypothetical protein